MTTKQTKRIILLCVGVFAISMLLMTTELYKTPTPQLSNQIEQTKTETRTIDMPRPTNSAKYIINQSATPEMAKKILDASHKIIAGTTQGSGFAIAANKLVTAKHVIEDADDIYIDGIKYTDCLTLKIGNDIAVITFKQNIFDEWYTISTVYDVGNTVFTIGYSGLVGYNVAAGTIIQVKPDAIVCQCETFFGMSGSPLINDKGFVIGVVCGYYEDKQHNQIASYAEPLSIDTRYDNPSEGGK